MRRPESKGTLRPRKQRKKKIKVLRALFVSSKKISFMNRARQAKQIGFYEATYFYQSAGFFGRDDAIPIPDAEMPGFSGRKMAGIARGAKVPTGIARSQRKDPENAGGTAMPCNEPAPGREIAAPRSDLAGRMT
jgi:hypothetical protein